MFVQVRGRTDQVARYFTQPLHSERGSGLDGDADGSVETFPDHIGHCVAQMQIEANWSRILPGGDAENRCDLVEPSRGWQGDNDNCANPPNNASVPTHSAI
jgi:hypothetical protein